MLTIDNRDMILGDNFQHILSSPFYTMILAYFHSAGTSDRVRDLLNNRLSEGDSSEAYSLRIRAGIPSGPSYFINCDWM